MGWSSHPSPRDRIANSTRQHATHLPTNFLRLRHTSYAISPACVSAVPYRECRRTAQRTRSDIPFSLHDGTSSFSTQHSTPSPEDENVADEGGEEDDILGYSSEEERSRVEVDEDALEAESAISQNTSCAATYFPFKAQTSRSLSKAQRRSQPTTVLDSIHSSARHLYSATPRGKTDLSHTSPRRHMPGGQWRRTPSSLPSPVTSHQRTTSPSLYSIISRYLGHLTTAASQDTPFTCTQHELESLQRVGLTPNTVQTWAHSLLETNSNVAARIFQHGAEVPPFFLVLLFLRREHIRVYALGVVLNHIGLRLERDTISWKTLKIVVVRVLRHARKVWPESIPWISKIFTKKAASIHKDDNGTKTFSSRTLGELTHFCNNLLSLLSLPSSLRPMIASRHQESAQFRILQFMAGYDPSIAVTRTGFRAVARIQLTHGKTEQEKDWAELKGPSWPPWKESRTAMDEGKGYEYGASRASKILHRMFEAGYAARTWEEVAEVYAGWDTDLSPTIQTRTLLPFGFRGKHAHRLWAARIRTTRTKREAWACFLAHETSGAPAHEEIYLAMFEKLFYLEAQRRVEGESQYDAGSEKSLEHTAAALLPGDMKEVLPDPSSPLHNVYLSEPVPTYEQFYRRMMSRNMRPTKRLLAFLLKTYPDFATLYKLLEKAKDDFNGGIGCLITGDHGDTSTVHEIPGYFLAAFIRFLCRFGHPTRGLSAKTTLLAPNQHARQFLFNENYLLEYAYALLLHYKPRYQPAWTAFAERVVFSRFGNQSMYHEKDSAMGITDVQYKIITKLLDTLASIDVDVEGELFNLACTATRYAAQAVHRGNFPVEQGRDFLATRSYRLRKLFHSFVGVHADPEVPIRASSIPSRIPGPAELHAYVRALGVLRDYEGLYSFSTWLTKNNSEVTARARAQHGGNDMLFRTLVALRAATSGWLEEGRDTRPTAPEEIKQLIKAQIASVEEWGGWPSKKYVTLYIEGHVRSSTPEVGGR
ncbi:hypothetical protein ST47_g6228 [Ascochyta rabiei]|uniref:Uncharacterized protein n=1 Tax=Didymella rabiei TaxID=5454 RepID=A0A163CL58_DIDRA|nr:hypothetical protein ST47_g6228 [Ascochyta rabiei]